ncbi:nitrite reductase small subunit NirD [Persicobacter psychrovividus]|uniref:Rieske domain-containing protein n=1 Tax=Persicobacter psychrovividus TaxID=387638 RepID=A0ABM7VI80_9BACT|nr:hypothetical protein PEPS_29470 [Persicobacter psychrovividus]
MNKWVNVGTAEDFISGLGRAVLIDGRQIAVFYCGTTKRFYASDNMCPHKQQMILARGIIGDKKGEPMVACPFHKKAFSLEDGRNLQGEALHISIYEIKEEDAKVWVSVPVDQEVAV